MNDLRLVVSKEEALDALERCYQSGKTLNRNDYGQINSWKKTVTDKLDECFESNDISKRFSKDLDLRASTLSRAGSASSFTERIPRALKYLRLLSKGLEDPTVPDVAVTEAKRVECPSNRRVFVVHGHDDSTRLKVEAVLNSLDLEPVVINSKANSGLTIIEKIEKHSDVGFAVVLFTPDDLGASIEDHESGKYEKRPRQNVVLELGYFWGQLGRERVCMLNSIGEDLSSDLRGLGYTTLDLSNAWKFELVKELKAAGYDVDANKLLA